MPGAGLGVSVVIPTRGRPAAANRAARAVLEEVVREVVLVDDAPGGGPALGVDDAVADDGRVRVIRSGGVGVSRARQVGAEAAAGDVVLFVDDDVVAGAGLAAGHLAHHRDEEGLVVVGYMPTTVPATHRLDDIPARAYARDYERLMERYERDPSSILRNLWGGNVSLRRSDALAVGMVGPVSFLRHEDRDFGLRCAAAGLRGRFDRDLAAEHLLVRTYDEMVALAEVYGRADAKLHEMHHEVLGELDVASRLDYLPRVVRRVLLASDDRRIGAAVSRLLRWTAAALRRPGTERLQMAAAEFAVVIASRRGLLAGSPPAGQPPAEGSRSSAIAATDRAEADPSP